MLALPVVLFLAAPLVLILTCASLLPSSSTRLREDFSRKGWYLASVIVLILSLWLADLADTELGHRLFHQSHGETTSAAIAIVGMMVSFIIALLGSTQKKWNKGLFRLLPVFLLFGSALAVPSLYFCMFYWPIGYLVISPLTCAGIVFLIRRAAKLGDKVSR